MSNDICKKHTLRKVFATWAAIHLILTGIEAFSEDLEVEESSSVEDPRPRPETLVPQDETSPLIFPFLRPLSSAESTLAGGAGRRSKKDVHFRKTLALPFVSYSPESRLMAGAGIMTVGHLGEGSIRPSSLRAGFLFSEAGHRAIRVTPEAFLGADRFRIWSDVGYYFQPDRFNGIGARTTDAQKESFIIRGFRFAASARYKFFSHFEAGPWLEVESNTISPGSDATLLIADAVPGARGGKTTGLGGILTLDTRNLIFNPSHGRFYELVLATYRPSLGSDFTYDRVFVDLREYLTPFPQLTLAFQWAGQVIWGTPSFLNLSSLGGNRVLRGYWEGRWRDAVASSFQAEARFPVIWRFGGTVFAGGGQVGSDLSNVWNSPIRWSGGFGVRFRFDDVERIQGRLDLAWGHDKAFGYYMYLTEAF